MRMLTKKIFVVGLIAALSLVLLCASTLNEFYQPIVSLDSAKAFEVKPGDSLAVIASNLVNDRILVSPTMFRFVAWWRGVEALLQAGEYQFGPGESQADILQMLVDGEVRQYRITFVEGWRFSDVLDSLSSAEGLVNTLMPYSDEELAAFLGLEVSNPEGMLHPDTYFYARGTTDLELLKRARERQELILMSHWNKRLGALPFATSYEALTLASIIEKESNAQSERGKIAGVFIRRLEHGMRLQSDPTVIYGLGQEYDGNLTRTHLQTPTEYNTYRIDGLPPTPISLAGETSIIASLNPDPGDSLYFVSRGDGTHYFSVSLDEHNAAVNRFQRNSESGRQ
ncbi:MAG: aminodeoxychorismate lyase [Gammaproteobacteria bacterium]|nr:aminodeoxychorismate lyase [Gammaproteobacteria bacterium]HBW84867.1 endolytic transglycosylase MltG [Gammaproteobacteria bacterium]|tara:strand:- start:43 stop:1062 length:1020 start_codon:yes stop_codon:yes gene_type:complete